MKLSSPDYGALKCAPFSKPVRGFSVPVHEIQTIDPSSHSKASGGAMTAEIALKNNEGNFQIDKAALVEMEKAALVQFQKMADLGIAGYSANLAGIGGWVTGEPWGLVWKRIRVCFYAPLVLKWIMVTVIVMVTYFTRGCLLFQELEPDL